MRDTRAELLAQGEILVRKRGYSGFSYADLSQAIGISKASIHHHFRTKEDLAIALVAAYDRRYDEALARIRAETQDGVTRIEAYGHLYLNGLEQGLGCLCAALAVEQDTLPDVLRAAVARFFDKHVAWLVRVFADGIANGSIRADADPEAHARMVVAMLEGALLMERLLAGPHGFTAALKAVTDTLRPAPTGRQ